MQPVAATPIQHLLITTDAALQKRPKKTPMNPAWCRKQINTHYDNLIRLHDTKGPDELSKIVKRDWANSEPLFWFYDNIYGDSAEMIVFRCGDLLSIKNCLFQYPYINSYVNHGLRDAIRSEPYLPAHIKQTNDLHLIVFRDWALHFFCNDPAPISYPVKGKK